MLRRLRSRREDPGVRLEQLRIDGRTVELSAMSAGDRVVQASLGDGVEFWRVSGAYSLDIANRRIEGGALIMDQGEPVRLKAALSHITDEIEELVYAV